MKNRSEILARHKPVRDNLLLILHDLQNNNPQHYISKEDIIQIARYLNLTYSSVYGVVSYYSMFSLKPRCKYIIRVCRSPVCEMENSENLTDELKKILSAGTGNVSADGLFTIETVECLGHCEESPVIMINDKVYGNLNPDLLNEIIDQLKSGENEK
jgi:NADH-quinone oxidoreductase subunit E